MVLDVIRHVGMSREVAVVRRQIASTSGLMISAELRRGSHIR
jgi:hypothetical protein